MVIFYHDVFSLQGEEESDKKYCVASNHEARKLLQIVRTLYFVLLVLVVIIVVVFVVATTSDDESVFFMSESRRRECFFMSLGSEAVLSAHFFLAHFSKIPFLFIWHVLT